MKTHERNPLVYLAAKIDPNKPHSLPEALLLLYITAWAAFLALKYGHLILQYLK